MLGPPQRPIQGKERRPMTSLRTPAVAAAAAFAVAAAAPAAALAKPATVTISGATGSAPLVGLLAQQYGKDHAGENRVKAAQGGGEVGIQDAAAGRVTIGNASRDPRPSDPPGIVFYPIAKDYFCFDTNPANPLPNLTLAQAQAIWTGAVRDRSQAPGAPVTGTIDLIGRTAASSLPPLVQQLLLGNRTISALAALKPSDGLVEQTVASDKNAIGFNSGYYASQKDVHAVAFNGVACNLQNAKSGQYPGVRTYYEVTRGAAKGAAKKFISWIQHSKDAQKIIGEIAIPLK